MAKQTITEYEVIDLGVDSPSYFQGFGCSYTRYDNAVVGIGDTAAEAYDDALEQIACVTDADVDVDLPAASELLAVAGIDPTAAVPAVDEDEDDSAAFDEGQYYYVGIRYNLGDNEPSSDDEHAAEKYYHRDISGD